MSRTYNTHYIVTLKDNSEHWVWLSSDEKEARQQLKDGFETLHKKFKSMRRPTAKEEAEYKRQGEEAIAEFEAFLKMCD